MKRFVISAISYGRSLRIQRENGIRALLPALLFVTNTLIFIPNSIYNTNLYEFSTGFTDLVANYVELFVISFIVLAAAPLCLSAKRARLYNLILLLLALGIWSQANLLTVSYGELDGSGLDMAGNAWRSWYEIPLWGILLVGGVSLQRFIGPQVQFIAAVFIILQTVLLLISPGTYKDSQPVTILEDKYFSLSNKLNMLHIILDQFGSNLFKRVLSESPAYADQLDGFTFYEDALGIFHHTNPAMHAIMTGDIYMIEKPLYSQIGPELKSNSFDLTLSRQGFEVTLKGQVYHHINRRYTTR